MLSQFFVGWTFENETQQLLHFANNVIRFQRSMFQLQPNELVSLTIWS
jgi:hypothetical protein